MMAKTFIVIVIVALVCTGCSSPAATLPAKQREAARQAIRTRVIAVQLRAFQAGYKRGLADCQTQVRRGDKGQAQKMALEVD